MRPVLTIVRKPSSAPCSRASRAGQRQIWPSTRRVVRRSASYSDAMCCFGISMKCTGASGLDVVEREDLVVLVHLAATGSRRARSCRRCSSCIARASVSIALVRASAPASGLRARPSRRCRTCLRAARARRRTSAGPSPCRASSTRQWNQRSATSATMRDFITVLRGHDRLGRLLADLLQDRVVALGEQRRDVGRRRIGAAARRDRRREARQHRRRRRRQPSP